MGKIKEILIDTFSGGQALDLRTDNKSMFGLSKNFDATTYKHKLIPNYQRLMDWTGSPESLGIVKVLYTPYTEGNAGMMFGLSFAGVNNYPKIYKLDIDSGLPGTWTACTNGTAGDTDDPRKIDVFFYYKGYIYLWDVNSLVRFKITDDEAWATSNPTSNKFYTPGTMYSVAQPVHHPSDDVAYFFHSNFISKLDNTSWSAKVFTLPATERITCACAYGDYLAVATVNNTRPYVEVGGQRSTVYLWGRDTSLTTAEEKIDFGYGEIMHLETLGNKLTAVMLSKATEKLVMDRSKILVKQYLNYVAIVNELIIDNNVADWDDAAIDTRSGNDYYLPRTNFKRDEKLYFPMRADLNGESRHGIWCLRPNGVLSLEIVDAELNDTTARTYNCVYCVGNIWFTSYSELTHSVTSQNIYYTDESKTYSTTTPSTYESLIFDVGDRTKTKKLLGATVTTEALPTNGRVILEYRYDDGLDDASWTELFDNTTDNSKRQSAILNSDGTELPHFKEIQFRIRSYGGAIITGLKFKAETIEDDIY